MIALEYRKVLQVMSIKIVKEIMPPIFHLVVLFCLFFSTFYLVYSLPPPFLLLNSNIRVKGLNIKVLFSSDIGKDLMLRTCTNIPNNLMEMLMFIIQMLHFQPHTHTHRYGIAIIINILWKLANIYIAKFKDLAIKSKYTLAPLGRCTNTDTLRKFSLLVQPIIEKKNTIINLLF